MNENARLGHLFYELEFPICASHSGCYHLYPRNTMEGFRFAIENMKMKIIEFDVRTSSDGHLILLHDSLLNITTNGYGISKFRTLKELKNLDAGFKFSKDNGKTFPFRQSGYKIPTLTEFYEEFKDNKDFIYFFDIKEPEVVEKVILFIKEKDIEKRTILGGVSCFVNQKLSRYPERKWLFSADTSFMTKIVLAYAFSALKPGDLCKQDIIGFPIEPTLTWGIHRKMLDNFKSCGGKVAIFGESANIEKDVKELMEFGVDVIFTDLPTTIVPYVENWKKL